MHEMALAEHMIQLVEAAAGREEACAVRRIVLEIGQLAAVDPEALRFSFAAVSRGGIAAGAALDIVEVAGAGRCLDCAATLALPERPACCPACGSFRIEATAGTAMRVRAIDIAMA